MDDPANPTVVNEPPWHVGDEKPPSPDSPRGGAGVSLGGPASPDASLGGPAEPPVSGLEPSAPSAVPPIPEWEIPKPSELPPIPEPIVPSPEIPVPQTPGETSLPPLPPPPFPTGGSETPFVIGPASAATTIKPPKKGGGGKAVLASLIFFFIAIATGIGFYFFQKGGLPFQLGKKAAPGACCNPNASPTGCGANENCVSDPIGGAGCTYPYICKTKTWAQQNCAGISVPDTADCCCRVIHPGCDEDCRWKSDGPGLNLAKGEPGAIYMQHCDKSGDTFIVGAQKIPIDYDCLQNHCTDIQAKIIGKTKVEGEICGFCKNKVWYYPPVTPTPTPTPTQPTTKITPTPTTPVTKITPTPTSTSTPTPTPPPLLCLKVEASKNGIILSNLTTDIVPGDIITIYVTAPYVTAPFGVTGFAVRIRTDGPPPIEHIAISSNPDEWLDVSLDCSQCVKWKYDYTIPAGGVGNYTIDGFVKSGGVWR